MNVKRLALALVVCLLALSRAVMAQSVSAALPTSADVLVLPAAGDPLTTAAIAVRNTLISPTAPLCNLAPSAAAQTPLNNPSVMEFDDPYHSGRICRLPMPAGLISGTGYRAVALYRAVCDAGSPCVSDRSAVALPIFNIVSTITKPLPPTNVQLKQ